MNLRGWTPIDDAEIDEALNPILDDLAKQWSILHDEEEQEGWRRQAAIEDGDTEPDYETEEEMITARNWRQAKRRTRELRIEAIETQLAEYGARMMRPYEHWNEDELLMEYQERER